MSFAANKADSGNLIERSHANWVNQAENQAIKFQLRVVGVRELVGSIDMDMVMESDLEQRQLHFSRSVSIRFNTIRYDSIPFDLWHSQLCGNLIAICCWTRKLTKTLMKCNWKLVTAPLTRWTSAPIVTMVTAIIKITNNIDQKSKVEWVGFYGRGRWQLSRSGVGIFEIILNFYTNSNGCLHNKVPT